MFKDTITYVDFNGNTQTEDVYFHLSKPELIEMEVSYSGGLSNYVANIDSKSYDQILEFAKTLIAKSYGKKSEDGTRFIKSKEITEEFMQTEAYSEFFMKLLSDEKYVEKFMLSVVPQDLSSDIRQGMTENDEIRDKFKNRLEEMKTNIS